MGQKSAANPQKKTAIIDEPAAELATELVLCSDGTIYFAPDPGVEPPGRAFFEGWEMSWPEALQAAGQLPLAGLTGFGLGSDAKMYGTAERIPPDQREGRASFRGYAFTDEERETLLRELHRVAFNATIAVMEEQRQRRIAAKKAEKKAKREVRKAEREAAKKGAPPASKRRGQASKKQAPASQQTRGRAG